jgi:hypothetical protein
LNLKEEHHMHGIPEQDRESERDIIDPREDRAFQEFCAQLTGVLNTYLCPEWVADANHRAHRALNVLTAVRDEVSERIQQSALRN